MVYYNLKRPPEGANVNWLRCTLNAMARYKKLQIGPSDWFERHEVERWFNDFGPDAILRAFWGFVADESVYNKDHSLQAFRVRLCELCKTGVGPLESDAYSKGKLNEARMKELSIGKTKNGIPPEALTPEEAFNKALKMSPHAGEKNLKHRLKMWCWQCQKYGVRDVLQAFEYFLKWYPRLTTLYEMPITNFLLAGQDGGLIREMHQRKSVTSASGVIESADNDKPCQLGDPKTLKPPIDVDSAKWRNMELSEKWENLDHLYHYPLSKVFDKFCKEKGLDDKDAARRIFVDKPELWPTAEDMRAEEARFEQLRKLQQRLSETVTTQISPDRL